jgi:anti-sigma regulatory factor (Ser/Thr protein kinase)
MSTLAAKVDLPPVLRSIGAARRMTLELLNAWAVEHQRDDAALVVTELITNVVDHVGGEVSIAFELTLSDQWLRISVADGSSVHPTVQELSGRRPRGRGMQIVAALADRWGCQDHHGGKRVWAELKTDHST